MVLRARQFEFIFPRPAIVMGVINVTPDSFSDGGMYFETKAAVRRGLELVSKGAGILDIGAESTRPNATPVSESEELRRVIPVIEQLASQVKIPISVDTMKAAIARAAIAAGASIVNNVAANREDRDMWRVIAESGAAYVVMHMQGTPQTMQDNPVYDDVVREVAEFFSNQIQRLNNCGVTGEHVILDVGIGFGKTLAHNLQLLGALRSFKKLERPLMLGVSRKSFIGKLLGPETGARLPAGLACAALAVEAGVQIIRAHDVAETGYAIRMAEAVIAQEK